MSLHVTTVSTVTANFRHDLLHSTVHKPGCVRLNNFTVVVKADVSQALTNSQSKVNYSVSII